MSIKFKFCPLCGKEMEKLIEGLCEECFKEKTPIGRIPERVEIYVCPKCGRYLKHDRWLRQNYLIGVIKEKVKDSLKLRGMGRVKVTVNESMDKALVKTVWYLDEKQEMPKEESHLINIKIHKRLCDNCIRRFGGYYVATVQLRGEQDEVDKAMDYIHSLKDMGDMWFIAKTEDVRGGVDVKLGSKDMDREIEKHFKKMKGVKLERSYTLVTNKTGKDLYRNTLLIRLHGRRDSKSEDTEG